ncbi:MAG: hypothetical protein MJ130_11835 [Lachnospiraceae bacterium]|nr:hypothetical protein [Lachnospiraceae bacterium]
MNQKSKKILKGILAALGICLVLLLLLPVILFFWSIFAMVWDDKQAEETKYSDSEHDIEVIYCPGNATSDNYYKVIYNGDRIGLYGERDYSLGNIRTKNDTTYVEFINSDSTNKRETIVIPLKD